MIELNYYIKKAKKKIEENINNIFNSENGPDFINAIDNYKILLELKLYDKLRERLQSPFNSCEDYGYYIALSKVQTLGIVDSAYYFPHILALYQASKNFNLDKQMIDRVSTYMKEIKHMKSDWNTAYINDFILTPTGGWYSEAYGIFEEITDKILKNHEEIPDFYRSDIDCV